MAVKLDPGEGPAPAIVPGPPYRPEGAIERLKRLLSTRPDGKGWARLGRTALWLVPALLLFGWMGGFVGWGPKLSPQLALLALAAFFLPVLVEEAVFRAILLKPPSDGAVGLAPALLSALLFAAYNLGAASLCGPLLGERCPAWADLGFDPWFLAATLALGLACARLALATRSIWPGALLHWTALVGWVVLFEGPASL